MRICVIAALAIVAISLTISPAVALVPGLLNLQGKLTDASNSPLPDASYNVTFRIYTASSGGTVLWTEATSVATVGGLFTTNLGSATLVPDSVFNNPDRWLGIQVLGYPEMVPRTRLTSVAYANTSAQWNSEGLNLNRVNGDIGIGTSTPHSKLDVRGEAEVTDDGATPDTRAYATFGVTRANSDTTGNSYIGLTKQGQVAWGLGIGSASELILGLASSSQTIPSPRLAIEPLTGNIKAGSKYVPVGEENLRIIRGTINGAQTVGSGFQWTSLGVGRYRITFSTPFASQPSVTATVFLLGNTKFAMMSGLSESYVDIDVYYRSDGGYVDAPVSFIAIGPR